MNGVGDRRFGERGYGGAVTVAAIAATAVGAVRLRLPRLRLCGCGYPGCGYGDGTCGFCNHGAGGRKLWLCGFGPATVCRGAFVSFGLPGVCVLTIFQIDRGLGKVERAKRVDHDGELLGALFPD